MTPQSLAQALMQGSYPVDQLPSLDHATLDNARSYLPPQYQNVIAPAEHQAFAREATTENPLMALPLAVATPLYSLMKAATNTGARSAPSWAEMQGGLMGIGQGLGNSLTGLFGKF